MIAGSWSKSNPDAEGFEKIVFYPGIVRGTARSVLYIGGKFNIVVFYPGSIAIVCRLKFLLSLILLLACVDAFSQDLEPRRWSRLPISASFLGMGLSNSSGDILFNPVLDIEDATLDYTVLGLSYIRTFGFFGKYARIDVTVPYARGRWEGLLRGEPASLTRTGFLDPYARFSVNLYGAPALKGKEFGMYLAQHPVNTTVGAAIAVIAPLGEYFEDKLINLGSNRWALRPQFGVLHEHNKWSFETTAAVYLFGHNKEFLVTQTLEQNPRWSIQGHVIRTFKPGLWASVSGLYACGGQSTIDGVSIDDRSEFVIWALSAGVSFTPRQGIKFAFIRNTTKTDTGSNLDTLTLAWSVMLGH